LRRKAVIQVQSIEADLGAEVRGSRLRTGSAQAAISHALQLKAQYSSPKYATQILYSGDFVDPAFAELTQLAQQHGLDFDLSGT
jgi:hypothetical protein